MKDTLGPGLVVVAMVTVGFYSTRMGDHRLQVELIACIRTTANQPKYLDRKPGVYRMPSTGPIFDHMQYSIESCFNAFLRLSALFLCVILLASCSAHKMGTTKIVGKNARYLVLVTGEGETSVSLAERFLGDPKYYWRIEDANDRAKFKPGQVVVVPRVPLNRVGVFFNGYQTVPIISYHRFGAGKGKLSVAKRKFEQQMAYLEDNGYRVIPLTEVLAFLRGKAPIPERSVVLTIDDGHRSVYQIAYPVLKKYGYPATIFIYSDYVENGGLTWRQMAEMEKSGLISFQPHSKTHDNLTVRLASEGMDEYKKRLADEVRIPTKLLAKRMDNPRVSFAYPYGDVNRHVVAELKRNDYQTGVTVDRGANPFFTYPFTLRRSMIYESDGITEFKRALRVFESRNLK